jgi:biopolymer transport protein ExbD
VKRTVDAPTEVTLPITPMLDLAFQLLFYFVIQFNPSSVREGQMTLSLPAKSEAAAKSPDQVSPTAEAHKEEIEDKAVVTIKIRGYKDPANRGKISMLSINSDNANDELVEAPRPELGEKLREKLVKVKPPETEPKDGKKKVPTVRMAADSDVRWSEVVDMMDVCYKVGFQVSFTKPPDLGSGG